MEESPTSDPVRARLCRTCRNLNLRVSTFINTGWRYPTSLEYDTEFLDTEEKHKGEHYIPGEELAADADYSDERLNEKLPEPRSNNIFGEDGLLRSIKPAKRKYLGTLKDVVSRSSWCTLCRLVSYVVSEVSEGRIRGSTSLQPPFEPKFEDDDKCIIKFYYDGQGSGYLTPDLMELDETLAYGRYECQIGIGDDFDVRVYPLIETPSSNWFGGRLYQPLINFALVRNWLHSCRSFHGQYCGAGKWHSFLTSIPSLNLIDVREMCLVAAPSQTSYIALSYVWGSVPMFRTVKKLKTDLFVKGGLNEHFHEIAATVQDAMDVVRELGERFLWTDAICITQDDPEEMKYFVGNMDVVYASAVLTIVAAEGVDAQAGLAGVRANSRSIPKVFEYGSGLKLVPARAPIFETLLACPWSGRGWTYQEGLLSPRMLVFTRDTVHLSCNSTTWSEDTNHEISENSPPPWKYSSGTVFNFRSVLSVEEKGTDEEVTGKIPKILQPEIGLFELWTNAGMELSERRLGFETDILLASAGILGILEKFYKVHSLCGLPESLIEDFLHWTPFEPGSLRRRVDDEGKLFNPSWSWCGWVGEILWNASPSEAAGPPVKIDWYKRRSAGDPAVLLECAGDNARAACETGGNTPLAVPFLDRQWPLLEFSTKTSRFLVSKSVSASEKIQLLHPHEWFSYAAGGRRLGVHCVVTLGNPTVAVGSVVFDSEVDRFFRMGDATEFEFVLISSAAQTAPDVTNADDAAQTEIFYNALVIERMGDVAERIGHGRILQNAWDGSNWERQEILLQ